ncbi:MAG: hypothetical protein AAGA58_09190 [Verrucomicrobiota bacterium]
MKILLPLILLTLATAVAPADEPTAKVVIAVGAGGTEDYRQVFTDAATEWEKAAEEGGAETVTIGIDGNGNGEEDLKALEEAIAGNAETPTPLWIALIGHGTFDGREAKFNLRGEDVTARKLASWLDKVERPVAIINATASSAPFIKAVSKENRIVVTATKSASEDSFARFGQFIAAAIGDPEADVDRDGTTSLLEAFLKASEDVAEFYEKEGRIATEQALIDDNGDGFGTPASWFRGVRAVKTAKDGAAPDGNHAHQLHLNPGEEERNLPPEIRKQRDALEAELFALRAKKEEMGEDKYYKEFEQIARALAELYCLVESPSDKVETE